MSKEEKKQLLNDGDGEMKKQNGLSEGSKLKETMIILAILFINMLGLCVDTMPMTFFNYEAKQRGLMEYQTGIIIGCYDFGRLMAGLVCPLIIKKISVKKSMILGASTCGWASVIFGLITYLRQPDLLFVLYALMRTISGSGAMLLNVSCTSILMQSKSYSNTTMFSCIELAVGLGYCLGGLIGGALIEFVGFILSFIVIGGAVLLCAVPCAFLVPNIIDVGGRAKGLGDFIKLSGTVIILTVFVATSFGTMGIYNMTGAWVVETFGVPISTWSMYYAGGPLGYIIGNVLASAITNWGYVYTTVFASAPGYILCFFFMCPSPLIAPIFNYKHSLPMTVVLFALHSVLETCLLVPLFQALVNLALANEHGADSVNTYAVISSAVNFAWAVGSMLGSSLNGTITQYIGFPWATTVIAAFDTLVITNLAIFLVIMKIVGKPLS